MNKISLFLFDLLKQRNTLSYLREFEKTKYLSTAELEEYQLNKLKKLLAHAEYNVPFYNNRLKKSGFTANSLSHLDQLKKIPPLTRQDLQNHWDKIISINYDSKKLSKGSSSGSTGVPVTYFKDNLANSAGQAAHYLGWSFGGWKMGHKGLHIWGNPSTVNNEWKRWSSKLKARIFKHHKFPAYKLTDGRKFDELRRLILKEKYDYIDGYTNAIYLFADYLKTNNLTIGKSIQYVLTTAENLQDFQRQVIKEMIAPVYDTYGCSEINGIAYECNKCGTYHVIDPHVIVEFGKGLDDLGTRELIVTDLDNFAFPFIRYKLDDLAIPLTKKKSCNIGYTQLKSVSGRQSDILKFKDGGTLSVPSFFGSMLLKQVQGLRQYQIIKESENLLNINFVTSDEFSALDYKKLDNSLKEYLNDKIDYKINFVEEIEVSETGKFKLLIDKTK